MNINQMALELFEKNEYIEALNLFHQAVEESRSIQSLTNLAWIYCYEENDDEKAIPLLEEVISMNPSSYLPYNLLGEIYTRLEQWQYAADILIKSISIHPSDEAYNNLGVAKYHLGHIQEASDYFLKASKPSDYAMYSHIRCLVELGQPAEAQKLLDLFLGDDDDFVGEVQVAELYMEMGFPELAIKWFERGWDSYWKQPNWVSQFVYCLIQTDRRIRAEELIQETILERTDLLDEIRQEVCDENWTESDKEERIKELLQEINEFQHTIHQILAGNIPLIKFDTSLRTRCYLFGCTRHGNPEYKD